MTVFALVLMGPDVAGITYSGALFNLGWVTLGNIVGGAVLVAYSYWVMSRSEHG
jgi:nitrite transporter NirC